MTAPVDTAFGRAASRFGAAHAEDATGHAARYHAALAAWVDRLVPDASVALRLAALCQHLRRGDQPRSAYPEGPAGYKRWRAAAATAHASAARAILAEAGVDDATGLRVGELLVKKGLRSDPETMAFEDAIALTFLEIDFAARALAGELPVELRALVSRALAGATAD